MDLDRDHLPERSRIVQEHLRAAGMHADVHQLPQSTRTAAEAAAALGCPVGAIASSLLFLADDEPLLVMTSGRHRVDPDVLAAAVGARSVVMASAKQVKAVTGQAIGGVAPTGHPAKVRTVVDATLRDYDQVWVAAGTPHTVVTLTVEELVALTEGETVHVASDQ